MILMMRLCFQSKEHNRIIIERCMVKVDMLKWKDKNVMQQKVQS